MLWLLFSWERDTVSIIYWKLGGPWGQSGYVEKILSSLERPRKITKVCLVTECKGFESEFQEMYG